jgi:hypothetical protein
VQKQRGRRQSAADRREVRFLEADRHGHGVAGTHGPFGVDRVARTGAVRGVYVVVQVRRATGVGEDIGPGGDAGEDGDCRQHPEDGEAAGGVLLRFGT